jgi:hypothetical protein
LGGASIWVSGGPLVGNLTVNPADANARVVSYRVVRCGVRIYPKANITVKAGMLTIGMVPGKTLHSTVSSI